MNKEFDLPLILIQDLTWVNGEVLALYAREPNDFYIERWVERDEGWDTFFLVRVLHLQLLGYLVGGISLYEIFLNRGRKKYIKYVNGQRSFSTNMTLEWQLPKVASYLPANTDFLDKDKHDKIRKLIPNIGPPPLAFAATQFCYHFNLGPPQNWGGVTP